MNKTINNAMFNGRETAAIEHNAHKPKIDFEVGDAVQIRASGKHYVGRVGLIIGARYAELENGDGSILYTVRFSDFESADYLAFNLSFVRAGNADI